MDLSLGKSKIRIIQGDITEQDVDVIVNAANSSLFGGGGVDGAIHRKGGSRILEECKKIRDRDYSVGLPTGKAVITSGGRLKARFVIHTVGPIWEGGNTGEPQLLADCYSNSLSLAKSKGLKTIAFPSISTGAYGYPITQASEVALKTVRSFLSDYNGLDLILLVLFSSSDLLVYEQRAENLLSENSNSL